MENDKNCFVILPFSKTEHHNADYWDRHFELYLKPLIKRKKLKVFRSKPQKGNIANRIITDLVKSDIVVADLTDHNPNVLWELGVRHSYRSCTITIAEEGTDIPFHLGHKGILPYNADHIENEQFEKDFIQELTICLEHPEKIDSPVLEALGGRGTLYSIVKKDENNRRIIALKTEVKFNKKILNSIYNCCKKNEALLKSKGEHEKFKMESAQLKTFATEFLYSNRYLDKTENFYEEVYDYIDSILPIIVALGKWSENPVELGNWLLTNKTLCDKKITEFENHVEEIKTT